MYLEIYNLKEKYVIPKLILNLKLKLSHKKKHFSEISSQKHLISVESHCILNFFPFLFRMSLHRCSSCFTIKKVYGTYEMFAIRSKNLRNT